MKAKFYICEHCGNLVTTIHNAGVPLVCCGEKMKELLPNTVEASGEKHLPVAELSGSTLTVTVGAVEHPMVDVHHIQWLFVETENGGQLRYLTPGRQAQHLPSVPRILCADGQTGSFHRSGLHSGRRCTPPPR